MRTPVSLRVGILWSFVAVLLLATVIPLLQAQEREAFAPADQAAFEDLVVGQRMIFNDSIFDYWEFMAGGRFKGAAGADSGTGSYSYSNTGVNTGDLAINVDDGGESFTAHLVFTSTAAGTLIVGPNPLNWRLIPIPELTTLYFPDYVDGGVWSVQLVLSNIDADTAAEVRVAVYDQDGGPILDLFDSESEFEIPFLGSRVLRSAGAEAIRRGWIEVQADSATVSGLLTYRHAQTGIEVSVEPVELGHEFALFVEESGTIGAGLALLKLDAASRIELRLRDEEGNDPLEGVFLPWRDFNQAARTLPEWFDVEGVDTGFLADFRGLLFLRTEDESPFAPLGLRFGKGPSSLSAVPAIRIPDGGGIDGGHADRDILVSLYDATDGPNWIQSEKWLTDGPLEEWWGVSVDGEGRVSVLRLEDNNLTGPIPPELGSLANLREVFLSLNNLSGPIPPELGGLANLTWLSLSRNHLSGPIPPELGNLASLTTLGLGGNALEGPIPPELGNLASLTHLYLWENKLSGPIPGELGNLADLTTLSLDSNALEGRIPGELGLTSLRRILLPKNKLSGPIPPELGNLTRPRLFWLHDNNLTGSIPPELGNLATLEFLHLDSNDLTGAVPPEIGGMSRLRTLGLSNNPRMEGPLPTELTAIRRLEELQAGDTGLCAGSDPELQAWLNGVYARRIRPCDEDESGPPLAYLTQAVQSREFPVPLVAGERALLRVFPIARQSTSAGIPAVRARFYMNGSKTHVVDLPAKSTPIPTEVDESSLSKSANTEIPGSVVQPGLEMVIDVDPNGTLDPALGVAKRIPETGRLEVEVRAMPLFDLTLIPFIWSQTQDSSIVDVIDAMAEDPNNHELLSETRTLLPVGELSVTAHEPVLT